MKAVGGTHENGCVSKGAYLSPSPGELVTPTSPPIPQPTQGQLGRASLSFSLRPQPPGRIPILFWFRSPSPRSRPGSVR